jgi:Uri superfamily endonuclease
MKKTEKLKQNAKIRSAVVQQNKTMELINKNIDGVDKQFVKVTDEQGDSNIFETIKKGADTLVKHGRKLILLGAFASLIGCATVSQNQIDRIGNSNTNYDDLMKKQNQTRVERTIDNQTDSPSAFRADGKTTPKDAENIGFNRTADRRIIENDIKNELNDIAGDALHIAARFNADTRRRNRNNDDQMAVLVAFDEILVAMANTATGSGLNDGSVGYANGTNQAVEAINKHFKQSKKRPNWIDGLSIITNDFFLKNITEDVTAYYTSIKRPELARKFTANIQKIRDFAANPTNNEKRELCRNAITEISRDLSQGYDLNPNTMRGLIELVAKVLTVVEKGKVIIMQDGMGYIRYLSAPPEQTQTYSGGGHGSSSSGSSSGSSPRPTPPSPPPPTPPSKPTTPPPGIFHGTDPRGGDSATTPATNGTSSGDSGTTQSGNGQGNNGATQDGNFNGLSPRG